MRIDIEEISTKIMEWHDGEESISEDGLFDDVWEALEEWASESGAYMQIYETVIAKCKKNNIKVEM